MIHPASPNGATRDDSRPDGCAENSIRAECADLGRHSRGTGRRGNRGLFLCAPTRWGAGLRRSPNGPNRWPRKRTSLPPGTITPATWCSVPGTPTRACGARNSSSSATGGRGGFQQAVELYQEALRPASQGLSPERELAARRRLSELMLQADELTAAESEVQKLRELEQKELAQSPEEWRAPGLEALRLAGKVRTFRGDSATEPPATLINEVEEAFKEVLEPETAGKPKVYQDPAVYLARYEYRLQRQLPNAKEDLAAALKLAPADSMVLLTAAAAAQSEAAAAVQGGNWEKAGEFFAKARDYYERGIKAAPADQRAYRGLGHLYKGVGEIDRAIQTWRRGLKEVKSEVDGIDLNLDLAGVLIQQGRLLEAETVLNGLDLVLAKLDPKSKLAVQRLLDLQRAKLLVHKGQYKDAKDVVANLAVGKDDIGGDHAQEHDL